MFKVSNYDIVYIVNFEHISHLFLVFVLSLWKGRSLLVGILKINHLENIGIFHAKTFARKSVSVKLRYIE